MNAYVSNGRTNTMFNEFKYSPSMICGLCGRVAARTGLPIWLVRTVAVLLLLSHTVLFVAIYLGAALYSRRGRQTAAWQPEARPAWDRDGLTERFARLDRRLARMEGAALDQYK
jgi:phage shock protein PspC (stress-responsive transcriptional regulator)